MTAELALAGLCLWTMGMAVGSIGGALGAMLDDLDRCTEQVEGMG